MQTPPFSQACLSRAADHIAQARTEALRLPAPRRNQPSERDAILNLAQAVTELTQAQAHALNMPPMDIMALSNRATTGLCEPSVSLQPSPDWPYRRPRA